MAAKLTWNISSAVSALNRNGKRSSSGYCARYVRMAIEAGGLSTAGRPSYAYLYTSFLPKIGFKFVTQIYGRTAQAQWSASSAQLGDIAIMAHAQYGHICMWNGRQWVSDFYQNNMWPYRGDGSCSIYRWNGEVNDAAYVPPLAAPPAPAISATPSLPSGNNANALGSSDMNPLSGTSDIYGDRNAGEGRTRIYQAIAPTLVLDQMVLNIDGLNDENAQKLEGENNSQGLDADRQQQINPTQS